MTKSQIQKMRELDEAAERAGGYVDPVFDRKTKVDYRKLAAYCKEKGIEPQDLTIRELHTFIIE